MIDKALDFLRYELDLYLQDRAKVPPEKVVLDTLASSTGNSQSAENVVYLTLANMEEERMGKAQTPYPIDYPNTRAATEPVVKLNLFVLFAPHYRDFKESLKMLYYTVAFFQGRPVFTPETYSRLDSRIEKIMLDLYSPTFEQQNHLWGYLGAKYLPSALYRLRLLVIDDGQTGEDIPPVNEVLVDLE